MADFKEDEYQKIRSFIETQEKQHYHSLTTLFKWIIASVTVIFSIGGGVLGCNIYQINANVKSELERANNKIEEFNNLANSSLDEIEYRSNLKIELLEKEIRLNTLSAAKLEIESELKSPALQQFIYSELRSSLNENLDEVVKEAMSEATEDFVNLTISATEINTIYQKITWNDAKQILKLDSIGVYSANRELRVIANNKMDNVREWFRHYTKYKDSTRASIQYKERHPETKNFSDDELLEHLISKVFNETDTFELTEQFEAILDLIPIDIKLFEFINLRNYLQLEE